MRHIVAVTSLVVAVILHTSLCEWRLSNYGTPLFDFGFASILVEPGNPRLLALLVGIVVPIILVGVSICCWLKEIPRVAESVWKGYDSEGRRLP